MSAGPGCMLVLLAVGTWLVVAFRHDNEFKSLKVFLPSLLPELGVPIANVNDANKLHA